MSNGTVAVNESELRSNVTEIARPLESREAGKWVRFFTKEGVHPFDEVEWKIAEARIVGRDGEIKFEQKDIEVPGWWDQTTINIVAEKYFRIIDGVRESSVRQMFLRVSSVLTQWAKEQNYFESDNDARIYQDELIYALLHQYGGFNSPVWFNIGVPGRRQTASACFISSVDDSLDGIIKFQSTELNIFRGGSGSGANLSSLRSSYEKISAGSYTSGPLAFMKGNDAFAGAMKSGGATRNAAKIVVFDVDHPDILETKDGRPGFIRCKAVEEKRAHDLIDAGYGTEFDDPNAAYKQVHYQNANHSVGIPDEFMRAVESNSPWHTRERLTGKIVNTYKARDLWEEIAQAAWFCGDPGLQFSDTINKWHTTPSVGKIRSSNPCFAPETLINTEFGLIRIDDLYELIGDDEVGVAVHLGDSVEIRPAIIFPTGINPLIKIQFRTGRSITVTPDHSFLLRGGLKKPAIELVPGDSVDIQCSEGSFGKFNCGLPATGWYKIAGFVVGDGWMTKYKIHSKQHAAKGWKADFDRCEVGLCFGKDDKDILRKVERFLRDSDVKYTLKRQKGSVGESPDYLRIRRKDIFSAMELIACPAGSRSHNKRIQRGVFEATRGDQLAFLAGLFSADGTFRLSRKGHGGNIPTRELRLTSTSFGLLQDVQALLLNLGIKSNIIKNRKSASQKPKFKYTSASGETRVYKSNRSLHELFIYGHSLRKLRDGIKEIGGLLSDRKQSQLDDLLPDGHSDPVHDIWHDEVVSVIDTGREELTYNMTEFSTHTIIAEGIRIPQCGEFLHIDNTACNLCAINLVKFFRDKRFLMEEFGHIIRIFVTAQDAIINKAEYPTSEITENSHKLRPIGLNYGNLGALLMRLGYAYDSDEGRGVAARLASMMTGYAYLTSSKLAARTGPFSAYKDNQKTMLSIMRMHRVETTNICNRWSLDHDPLDLEDDSIRLWNDVIESGNKFGFTVSQATLQAPLGTTSFLLQADTTGIEPAISLVSYKSLVGGGYERLVNRSIKASLQNLGYSADDVRTICNYVESNGYIEGAAGFNPSHLSIFDCALPTGPSNRYIPPMAHIKMLAAIQPLITCAQSKTINLPNSVTPEEIANLHMKAWKLGLKSITVYRDGCKKSQPLSTKRNGNEANGEEEIKEAKRRKMPTDCVGARHRFSINGHKGYLVMNEYPDGTLGEVFLKLGKSGSTMGSLIDGFTQLLSIALQYGVPLDRLIQSFVHTKFEPAGMTMNPNIQFTDSLYDYLFKLLDLRYFDGENSGMNGYHNTEESEGELAPDRVSIGPPVMNIDAPPCGNCGAIMKRSGRCHLCDSCGHSSGCS